MKKILFIILSLSLLTECGIYRKTDARKIPGNVNDRVQKNLEEGKRIKFGGGKGRGDGNFSFATSNEMWRATIEILDFVPLTNVDYGGGIIFGYKLNKHFGAFVEGKYNKYWNSTTASPLWFLT